MHERLMLRLTFLAGLWALGLSDLVGAASPFDNAAAVWHMNKANDPGDRGGPIAIRGDVKLGVELTGSEREASLRRGGDGRVARFNGGYLRVGSTGDGRMALHGKEMTLCVRLQDPHGDGNAFLFGKDESTDSYANVLYRQNGYLRYLWQTEPLARRVLGAADKRAGYGFNGESNDRACAGSLPAWGVRGFHPDP